ncbi:MAG TPA: cytochrome-c oxidase, cbb3-type subunit III, partial [Steroidobacteraceae bacterium]|nr:cytochrome-c oxidase, cbb3-type subunit III [Steroidobacteraceae bacterium]
AWLVTAVVLANIAALVLLLAGLRRRRGETAGTTETTGHVWDEDLRELNNPLPRWWLWLFIITVVFGLGYLVAYPGLGNYAGVLGWSSQKQWGDQTAKSEAVLARTLAQFNHQSVVALAANPDAVRVGRNLFMNNCATCHGSDGRGAPGFPNLTDKDWLWGGTPEAIVQTIAQGRISAMPAWRDVLGGDAGVEDMVAYVLSLSGRHVPAGNVEGGRAKFATICAACHGADGRGNQLLGAPNLTDQIWLNGGGVATVRETIAKGRQAQMPAQLERLGQTRVNLLAAYVISLGGADVGSSARTTATATPAPGAPLATGAAASSQ